MPEADLGIGVDRANRASPLVWRHPHARGACVVEDLDGSLWLLFEREGASAWARRRRWTNGVALLLPFGPDADDLVSRLGYQGSFEEPTGAMPTPAAEPAA